MRRRHLLYSLLFLLSYLLNKVFLRGIIIITSCPVRVWTAFITLQPLTWGLISGVWWAGLPILSDVGSPKRLDDTHLLYRRLSYALTAGREPKVKRKRAEQSDPFGSFLFVKIEINGGWVFGFAFFGYTAVGFVMSIKNFVAEIIIFILFLAV